MNTNDWVKKLDLQPHAEGGYFKQTYKSDEVVTLSDGRVRALSTSIYFLLSTESPSHFHRLKSDETWYYHDGHALTVHMLHPDGTYSHVTIGSGQQDVLQYTVPKGTIFGSSIESKESGAFAVVSCVVSPAFEYEDFELFTQEQLLAVYPTYEEIIMKLAYETI